MYPGQAAVNQSVRGASNRVPPPKTLGLGVYQASTYLLVSYVKLLLAFMGLRNRAYPLWQLARSHLDRALLTESLVIYIKKMLDLNTDKNARIDGKRLGFRIVPPTSPIDGTNSKPEF